MKRIHLLLFAASFLFCFNASAQFGMRGVARYMNARADGTKIQSYLRSDVGYSMLIAKADFYHHIRFYNADSSVYDSTFRVHNIHPKIAYGATVGWWFPLGDLGENGKIALGVNPAWNAMLFSTGDVSVVQGASYNLDIAVMQIGVPMTFDFKFGCDAMCDKSKRFCYGFGMGINPTWEASGPNGGTGTSRFRIYPQIKAEAGVFAGICFKVRATYTFGKMKFLDDNGGTSFALDGSEYQVSMSSKSVLALSLVLMPFSWDWDRNY